MKLGFEIIWNFIESVGVSCLKSIATEDIINNLKRLFENIMKTGYKLEDKVIFLSVSEVNYFCLSLSGSEKRAVDSDKLFDE